MIERPPVKPIKNLKQPNFDQPSIYSYQLGELTEIVRDFGADDYRAEQIFEWLYQHRVGTFDEMTNIPESLRSYLNENYSIEALETLVKQESKDGTMKFLFKLRDGYSIETVLMRHDYGNSVCVTTQVGCQIGCTFCASTLGGLKRNLEAGEIVAQVVQIQRALDETNERVSSIVIMGIGEPFENYNSMMNFIRIINHDDGLNIGARHITVSTSGIVPRIYDFADEDIQINFAVSLHAADNDIRTSLMPINKAYDIEKLMHSLKYYQQQTNRRVTFEYGLFGGVNDQVKHANLLADLISDLKCHVNLIPVNHVPERKYVRTSRDDIFQFLETLNNRGVNATLRREQGADIDAACGQLRAKESQDEIKG